MDDEISADELGDLLEVSGRRVRQLAAAGVLARASRGRYGRRENVRAYVRHLRAAAAPGSEAGRELAVQRARLMRERADAAARDNRLAAGEVIEVAVVEREWMTTFRGWRTGVLGLPGRFRQLLPRLMPAEIAVIEAEIRRFLTEFANARAAGRPYEAAAVAPGHEGTPEE